MGASNRSTDSKVWYALGTEGGVKEGRPLFKQWLKKRPVPQPQNFEEVNGKYYLTFDTMSGVVEIIKTQIAEGAANFDLGTIGDQLGGLFGEGSPLGNIGDVLGGLFGKK